MADMESRHAVDGAKFATRALGEALRYKHVYPRLAERPVNQEGCVWEFGGLAVQLNGLITHDLDAIGSSLRLEKRFKLSRRLYHHKLRQRESLVDEGIEAVWKL
ncbi:MAG TPA: hypothetical protein VKG91_19320 [Roseiarcus sp.]|nr:hypothetical protein [Roseiarcus sp.]